MMRERGWFSIVEENGEKFVHHHGFMAEYWKDDLWSFVDVCGACFPLSQLVSSDDWEEREGVLAYWAGVNSQYQIEYHEAEALEMRDGYYDGEPGIGVCLAELSMDTPCGHYWFEED